MRNREREQAWIDKIKKHLVGRKIVDVQIMSSGVAESCGFFGRAGDLYTASMAGFGSARSTLRLRRVLGGRSDWPKVVTGSGRTCLPKSQYKSHEPLSRRASHRMRGGFHHKQPIRAGVETWET